MSSPLDITIASLDEVEMLAGTPFTKIISISDAYLEEEGGYEHRLNAYFPKARIMYSYFDDVDYEAEGGPQDDEIGRLLDFSRRFTSEDKILIHCRAGISRSTALAYAIICQHSKSGQEGAAFSHVSKIRPQLLPNRLIIKMADEILKRKGRLIKAASVPTGH